MLFLFEVQDSDSGVSLKPVGHVVVFTTVAAKATQSRLPVDVMLITREKFRTGKSSLLIMLASMSPRRGGRSVGLTHQFCP